jgi:uncharacterized membrane protein YgcG
METKELESTSYILPDLGIQKHDRSFIKSMRILIDHLHSSYPEHYVERVKERYMRHSDISEAEWEHRWFEWERYLIIKAILPSVQMYSSEVDEVWHEMLLFTQRYMTFSQNYLNTMLHHTPNEPDYKFSPHDRAFFDLIYVLLFQPTPYSQAVWGRFFRYPLSENMIRDFQTLSTSQLKEKYFNSHASKHVPRVDKIIAKLIQYIKGELNYQKTYFDGNRFTDLSLHYLSGFLLFSTFNSGELFSVENWNDPEDEEEEKDKGGGCGGGGSCGGDGGGCSGCGGCGGCGG